MNSANDDILAGLPEVIASADPIPPDLLAAVQASFHRRVPDAEVAELVFDSAVDETPGLRAVATGRALTFEGPGMSVDLELVRERRVVGQITPPGPRRVDVRSVGGVVVSAVDELGRFVVDDFPKGPVSLVCHLHDGSEGPRRAVTDWVVV